MSRALRPSADLGQCRRIARAVLIAGCTALAFTPDWAAAETDHASAKQSMLQELQRANQAIQPPPSMPHRSAPTFRRILMQRGLSDLRQVGDRRPPHPSIVPQQPSRTVAVFGDRFGQALASGLAEASTSAAVLPLTSDDAGLTRADFADWLGGIRSRLARPDRPNLAIVMLGSNDRQPIEDKGKSIAPADAAWQALYAARVDALASTFAQAHVPLIWVGLPSVHSDEISADFVRLNGIVRDRVARAGGTYVDSWEAFADDTGRYSPVGPDLEGDTVKLRKGDGFGFTRAGARKLASFVENDLKRLETSVPVPQPAPSDANITLETARDFDQALQIDVNAQIRREAGLAPDTAPAAPLSPAPDRRGQIVGPVIPLTAPLSPDGQLAGGTQGHPAPQTTASVDGFKPGRADDFRWPKP